MGLPVNSGALDGRQASHSEAIIRILGFSLIGIGLLALVVGGFSYTKRRDTVELGPVKATLRQRERVSIPPLLGAIAVIAGVGLIVVTSRRRP